MLALDVTGRRLGVIIIGAGRTTGTAYRVQGQRKKKALHAPFWFLVHIHWPITKSIQSRTRIIKVTKVNPVSRPIMAFLAHHAQLTMQNQSKNEKQAGDSAESRV